MNILNSILVMLSAFTLGCGPVDGGFKSLDVNQFEQFIAQSAQITILDARTAQEFADGHLRNAVNIDVNGADFEGKAISQLDKNLPVAVYCRSGRRSKRAAQILVKNGFTVVELDCGIICWTNSGKEVVR